MSRTRFVTGFGKLLAYLRIVAGIPFGTPGATNMVRIAFVGSDDIDGA